MRTSGGSVVINLSSQKARRRSAAISRAILLCSLARSSPHLLLLLPHCCAAAAAAAAFRIVAVDFAELQWMEVMDSVAVMEVSPVPKPPLEAALALRRSVRCLNRTRRPTYVEQEEPKESAGRRRGGKRKREEEKKEPVAQHAMKPVRMGDAASERKPSSEGKPMPAIAAEPVSCAGFARPAAEDDVLGNGKSAKLRVKETLRAFTSHYLHLVQEEQKRAQAVLQEGQKRPSKRPDLKAITKMQESNAVLYPEKIIGELPGVDVGDQFYSRAEMVVLGIHSHWLNGIDYMGMKYQGKEEYANLTFPLATCIVMSGIYEDDLDKADEIIYTGQGGNDLLGNHRQIGSQQLQRGNLALKNSKDNGNPIRVIRGHISKNSYTGKVYTYDGLYKMTGCRMEYKGTLVCDDISGGQENLPIPATNLVDDPPVPPTGFVYSKSLKIPKGIKIPSYCNGCDCEGDCANNKNCSCAQRNGSDLPYVSHKNIGRLVEPKAIVFECGANCSCNNNCVNRTSQKGLQYRLEVFKTASKGWGVRTWDTILPGAPICEYTGVLRRTEEVDGLLQNNYIFDIDCLQTMKGLDGREKRAGSDMHLPSLHAENDSDPPAPEYCIDAGSIGNFARFINHSCEPNLFVQCVLSSHNDVKLAKVTLFAADTILPLQELSYDYGYVLDSVVGPDGNIVKLPCFCGAPYCRKRLY
uniref:SET domain-containing protein n=1 Tax=Oryza rufipogon TaxID=4529 RepID=A0A0E0N725_ORYRU